MEAAAPVINQVVESLMARTKKELGYWWNSEKNVEDMGSRMKQLSDTAEDMKRKKEANDVNHLVVPHHVSPWLEDVKKIKDEVARIPTDGIGIGCCNIKMRYKVGKQCYDILPKIDRLEERKSKIEWTNEQIPLARVPSRNAASTTSPVEDSTENSFESRDLILNEALKSLEPKNSKTHMMALCGMGGVGKTYMMEQLEQAVVDSNMFSWVVKVVIGQKHSTACQDAVAQYMGMPLTETDKEVRAGILAKRFQGMSQDGEKKILVILDDLWKVLDLKDIGLRNPLPNGFKLLLTTRDANICTQMGVDIDSVFRIGALNDDEAKRLFFETAGLSKDDDPDLFKVGEDIIKRCGNLPIALKIIASTLKGHIKDETEWVEALSRLQHHDLKDHYETVHEVFKISYNSLKVKDEQAIFLLSGLFPDDFDIPLEELMRYAWGLKLLSKGNSAIKEARRQVKVCVNKLTSANLLANSDHLGCVRMHDLARDFALSNITEVKQASIVNHDEMSKQLTKDANESFQRILLKCKDISEFPVHFNCPNLTFLKIMGGNEQLKFPQDFYENMEKLQVISYEAMQYPLLPKSLHCFTSMTTLCLHGCELISDCSIIGDLVNLEVLSFADCHIDLLPSSIGKLNKLKLLDLTGSFVGLRIEDSVFRGLVSLEELYIRVIGRNATITFTDANYDELGLLLTKLSALELEFFGNIQPKSMSFKNLERFKISVDCLLKDDKDKYSFQNTLKLITNSSYLMECKINELFKKTEYLYLQVDDMKQLKDVTMQSSQHSFSKLRVLKVSACEDLRYLFTIAMASGLRQLERLEVSHCDNLESLIHGDEGENAGAEVIKLKELKFLALNNLLKLRSLCDIDIRVELPQLVDLKLHDIPNFTSIYPDNAMQAFFNKKVGIPKLEKLYIHFLKNLKQIWPFEIPTGEKVHISMVREVDVANCESLVNLFPTNPMPMLRNLEKVQVVQCDSLEVLFNIDLGRVGKISEVSSSLSSIQVKRLKKLREIWKIKGADNSSLLISGFQAVKNIHIQNCMNYRDVFTPNDTNFDMRAVVDIEDNFTDKDFIFREALKFLEPNNTKIQMMALCGMGSVGKTRMMEDLVKAVEDMRMFDLVLKLVVGRGANPIALQEATAGYIGGVLTEAAREARADILHKRFMQISQCGKKNILVILDDLWEVLDLEDIGLPNPLLNGFKLLITSRDANVCTQMGTKKSSIFRLGVEDDAEAKTLFFETTGLLKDDDPDLYKIGEEIIMRCGNFPISLEIIASVLKGDIKDKSKWEEALSHLQNHDLGDIYDVLEIAYEMSYNNLKTDEKAILLLCGFFPQNSFTSVEELMRYAWGLKLFPNVYTTLAQARHRTKASIDVLIHAKFLTKAFRGQDVRMKQEVHDFVSGKFTSVKQAFIDVGSMAKGADESYERGFLNCTNTSEFPEALNYPNLKLLKLMGEKQVLKFPQDFYDRTENLEVVAYEEMDDPLLPQYSTTLRTLCLDSCSLTGDFSFLGNLINLEILSFAYSSIQKLPSTIGKLRKLKLLDVTGCIDLCIIEDGVFSNLVNLEELYMRADGSEDILFTDANYEELETLSRQLCALEVVFYENKLYPKDGSFDKLEKFNISMGCHFGEDEISSSENTLKLVTNRSHLLGCKIHELFRKANRLYLQVKDMNNLGEVWTQYSFCCLREVHFSDCADLKFMFTVEVASALTKLEQLEVSWCPVLETLIHDESEICGSVVTFPKLKYLSLKELPRLMSLCDTGNRVELQGLVELRLDGLPNITTIYPDDASQPYAALFTKQVHIPNMEILRIKKMDKLKQIWPCETATTSKHEEEVDNNVSMLRKIKVKGCESLENLFPCNPLPLLNHLEKLHVEDCDSIQVLFNIDLGGASANMYTQPTSSLYSIYVSKLKNLREIWRIKGTANDDDSSSSTLLIRAFQSVTNIQICSCRRFRDVFTPKDSNFEMRADVRL